MLEFDRRNARTWSMLGANGAFGVAAADIAETDKDFAVVTADLCFFSGLDRLKAAHPEKIVNVGIAEQNMIGVASGMVKEGMNVFTTTYASFASTRVLDQVKVSMGYMGLPVKLVGLTSGYSVGILGPTHMALEDIAIMRTLPGVVVLSPADCMEVVKCTYAAYECDKPVYIRLSGTQRMPMVYTEDYDFEIGKAITLREGSDVAVIATGTLVAEAVKAADALSEEGISCTVINMHTISPLDEEAIRKCAGCKVIVAAEEHSVTGGLGSAVADVLCTCESHGKLVKIGTEGPYLHGANFDHLMKTSGLDSENIINKIKEAL